MDFQINQIFDRNKGKKGLKDLCSAPCHNIYFRVNGYAALCCQNHEDIIGKYPENSLKEIFEGKKRKELSKAFTEGQELSGCSVCYEMFKKGNPESALFQSYNLFAKNTQFPATVEFELSNHCNLKCQMCNSMFSDKHEIDGEYSNNLIYDRKFVDQLIPYIPYFKVAGFKGGEPFMISLYYDIWEEMVKLNKDLIINVTTNGTILNDRVRKLLSEGTFNISVSVDTLDKVKFEQIRENASYEKFRDNIDYFMSYCRSKHSVFNVCTCLMTNNYQDIPEIFKFADNNDFGVRILYVETPFQYSFKYSDKKDIAGVIDYFRKNAPSQMGIVGNKNIQVYNSMIKQLEIWHNEELSINSNLERQNTTQLITQKKQMVIKKIQQKVSVYYNIPVNVEENDIYKQQMAKFRKVLKQDMFYSFRNQISDILLALNDDSFFELFDMTEDQLIHFLKNSI